MGKINGLRVLVGGVIAGLVINVFEAVVGMAFMDQVLAAFEAKGLVVAEDPATMAVFVALGFVVGGTAVWFYAAVRPRYGPGPLTAMRVGFGVWVLWYLPATSIYWWLDLFTARFLAIGLVLGLVEILLATVLGAWIYREEKGPRAASVGS